MEITFCELKNKDIINVCEGKNLGQLNDLVFDSCTGKIIGIIAPTNKNIFNIFKSNNELFIPYNRICKIGKDIILVDIFLNDYNNNYNCKSCNYSNQNQQPKINIQSILNKTTDT